MPNNDQKKDTVLVEMPRTLLHNLENFKEVEDFLYAYHDLTLSYIKDHEAATYPDKYRERVAWFLQVLSELFCECKELEVKPNQRATA